MTITGGTSSFDAFSTVTNDVADDDDVFADISVDEVDVDVVVDEFDDDVVMGVSQMMTFGTALFPLVLRTQFVDISRHCLKFSIFTGVDDTGFGVVLIPSIQ